MSGRRRGIYPPARPGVRRSWWALVGWLAIPVGVGAGLWWMAITLVQIGCQAGSVAGMRLTR